MNISSRIESLPSTLLVGKRIRMSFANNLTHELWRSFMPGRKEVLGSVDQNLYSVEIYPDKHFFSNFDPAAEFEKWAALKVSESSNTPDGMECLEIPEGLYGVFLYKGKGSEAAPTFQYILGEWIPKSHYQLDHRPHFALMGEKYKNEDPNSEEELWIPLARN